MPDLLGDERRDVLDAIDRRREESAAWVPPRADLHGASPRTLRRIASELRSAAWGDKTASAEEAAEGFDDPGWAPNATLRVAALVDHLSELSVPSPNDAPPAPIPSGPPSSPTSSVAITAPPTVTGAWSRVSIGELRERLEGIADGAEVLLFDLLDGAQIARATSWRGEVVEILDLKMLEARNSAQQAIQRGNANNEAKSAATSELARLKTKPQGWAEACVRAGYARPHFGPELTADFFRTHACARERLDITVDLNAIIYGVVHHIARVAPHVDFARSSITDLEIQRLADRAEPADKLTWRKACRALEALPVDGPVWRTLSAPDTTALLVARSEQKGKAPGADALLAHNFEEALLRAHGIRTVLLTGDSGLARTVASRLPRGALWVGFVDPLQAEERFVSPILSWPRDSITVSRYSSLADLIDELLVCGIADRIVATDDATSLEFRAYIAGEHQYVRDWQEPRLFVRGLEAPRARSTSSPVRWPLQQLQLPTEPRPAGARVTVEQVAVALEWVRSSVDHHLERERLPLTGDAKREAWTFLRAVELVDSDERAVGGRAQLAAAAGQHDVDALRAIVLRFEPVTKIVAAVSGGARTVAAAKRESDLGERTFGAALNLAVGCGLIWRNGDHLGSGLAFVSAADFRAWLVKTVSEQIRISDVAERAAAEIQLSPPRFREALEVMIKDGAFVGARGGTAEPHHLDAKVLQVDDDGRITVEELHVDDLLGLRSLAVR